MINLFYTTSGHFESSFSLQVWHINYYARLNIPEHGTVQHVSIPLLMSFCSTDKMLEIQQLNWDIDNIFDQSKSKFKHIGSNKEPTSEDTPGDCILVTPLALAWQLHKPHH